MSLKKKTWFSTKRLGNLKKGEIPLMLKDEDIQYIEAEVDHFPDNIDEPLAIDENYIEAKPHVYSLVNLSPDELSHQLVYVKNIHMDADFYTVEGAHWTYTAATDQIKMQGYENLKPACKFFSPSQDAIDAIGAETAREYKYDRAYLHMPCCQSRNIESPTCIATNNHSDCMSYQPEEWTPVKLAITEDDKKLQLVRGRLYSGLPYRKLTKDNKILAAAVGSDIENLDKSWDQVVENNNATEQPLPETGPKNPYLQSLLA